MASAIHGISYALPKDTESIEQLCEINPTWNAEAIFDKLGIRTRHIARPDETATDLAFNAATDLLERLQFDRSDIDYLIYCTQSPDHYLPSGACFLHKRLAMPKHAGAFDFNLGCSGYVYGLQIASSLIASGAATNVLLLTADTYSKFASPHDRNIRPIFGDGATATLIGVNSDGKGEIGSFIVGTDGNGAEKLIVPSGGLRRSNESDLCNEDSTLFMDGRAVFGFAISAVPRLIRKLMLKSDLTTDEIDMFVLHQANKYMLEQLAKRLMVPQEKILVDVEEVGNTVSSSIPLALKRSIERRQLVAGNRLLLVGFGVGYSWAGCDVVLGEIT